MSVPCQAPPVHTPAVNKYVGALFPRTRQGPYYRGIGQMDRSPILCRTNIFIEWPQSFNDKLISSVDTPLTGVDTMLQTQGKIMKKWSSSVDTGSSSVDTMLQTQGKTIQKWSSGVDTESSSVDTRPSSQRTQSTGLYWVSTQDKVVST
ncbi:hypothetical protein Taro_039629 [Colocasia esculenta]|uniref:Uncharacterized protein n=1 Tax=Colocasia esculenta TaxID=4460 RepID=A0A843WW96_COLES|nr:hypothetical protein [Colocasia esculenta]